MRVVLLPQLRRRPAPHLLLFTSVLMLVGTSAATGQELALARSKKSSKSAPLPQAEPNPSASQQPASSRSTNPAARPLTTSPGRRPWLGAEDGLAEMLRARRSREERVEVESAEDVRFLAFVSWLNEPIHLDLDTYTRSEHRHLVVPDQRGAIIEYQGIDRVIAKKIGDRYKRVFKDATRARLRERPIRWLDEEQDAYRARHTYHEQQRFQASFPAYWADHESFSGPLVLTQGELIDVLRVGTFTFTNDGKLRNRRRNLQANRPSLWPEPRSRNERLRDDKGGFLDLRQGNDLGDGVGLGLRGRMHPRLNGVELKGELEIQVASPFTGRDLCELELEVELDPFQRSFEVVLTFQLVSF